MSGSEQGASQTSYSNSYRDLKEGDFIISI